MTAFGYAAPRLRFWYATASGWDVMLATLAVGFDHDVWSTRASTIEFSTWRDRALPVAVNLVLA